MTRADRLICLTEAEAVLTVVHDQLNLMIAHLDAIRAGAIALDNSEGRSHPHPDRLAPLSPWLAAQLGYYCQSLGDVDEDVQRLNGVVAAKVQLLNERLDMLEEGEA